MLEKFTSETTRGWRLSWSPNYLWKFGLEKTTVVNRETEEKYLTRWLCYFGLGTLRLHKFWRGDDDRASHTHPWWFITFPFRSYIESVFSEGAFIESRTVKAFRFHFRRATFEHVVQRAVDNKPFYTLVLTGGRKNDWGFYPEVGKFVYWRNYEPTTKRSS